MSIFVYKPKKIDYNKPFREWLKDQRDNMKQLNKLDEFAKAADKIVGRVIRECYADGYAHYQIIKENKKTVRIRVCIGLGDDWVIPYWGEETNIDKEYAIEKLKYRDKLSEIFGKTE